MTSVLKWEIDQLRYAYSLLVAGTVYDDQDFANALIAPVIESLVAIQEAATPTGNIVPTESND